MNTENIQRVNHIYACMNGGSLHARKVFTNDLVQRMSIIENRYPVAKLPMCERCERAALWHHNEKGEGVGYCKMCGTTTVNPMTYGEYLAQGEDLPMHVRQSPLGKKVMTLLKAYDTISGFGR